jgi:hypothetical protein
VSARVSEVISRSYRIDENALRDLDAIVRSRCQEIVPSPKLTYEVVREDSLTYETNSVDDIVAERNGPQTRIRSVTLKVSHGDAISLRLEFSPSNGIDIDASADDRAKLSLLASDLRNLVRDEMAARGGKRGRLSKPFLWRLPAIPLACGLFVLVFVLAAVAYRTFSPAMNQYDRQVAATEQRDTARLHEFERAAEAVKASNETSAKLNFLIDAFVYAQRVSAGEDYPDYSYPWILSWPSFWVGLVLAGIVGWIVIVFVLPKPERLFLFGDQIARQEKRDKQRTQLIWGVLIAFVVGVASSIVASAVL